MNKQLKVLIADDNELMRTVMKALFDRMLSNPEVISCTNLKDTFVLLEREYFDFLLLDINMPGGDSSPDSIKEIHAINPGLKICMFTGNDKKLLAPLYMEAGAIGFIQKDDKIAHSLNGVLQSVFS